ncbi:MAG: hypothetical protein V4509_04975, partial [Patescibacteria group bacterium]
MSIYKSRTLKRAYSFASPLMIFMITLFSFGGVFSYSKIALADTISNCNVTITTPGTYTIQGDIGGGFTGTCITIQTDDVVIDGAGYSIGGSISGDGQP